MAQRQEGPDPHNSGEPRLDINCVIRAQEGDEEAFNLLYLQYFPPVGIFLALLVGDKEVGHELAQETFIRAWRGLKRLQKPAAFVKWLYQIAQNVACDYWRHTKPPCVPLSDEHNSIPDRRPGPDEQVEITDNLKCAITAVSLEYRVPLVLYHIRGMPKARIAELLDLEESSVGTYISMGMRELRAYLLQTGPNSEKEAEQ